MPSRYAVEITVLSTVVLLSIVSARSAPPRGEDPNWPCQQRLVPRLSAAAYWNGPSLEKIGDWHADPEVADLFGGWRRSGFRLKKG